MKPNITLLDCMVAIKLHFNFIKIFGCMYSNGLSFELFDDLLDSLTDEYWESIATVRRRNKVWEIKVG